MITQKAVTTYKGLSGEILENHKPIAVLF